MGGRRKKKICMSLRIFGIYTCIFCIFSSVEQIWPGCWSLGCIWRVVSCLVHDWLCGRLLGLETQGSSSDLLPAI
jgi:hypothetical protein